MTNTGIHIWLSVPLQLEQKREETKLSKLRVWVSPYLHVLGGWGMGNYVCSLAEKKLLLTLSSNMLTVYRHKRQWATAQIRETMSHVSFSSWPSINSEAWLSGVSLIGSQRNAIQISSSDGLAHFRDTTAPEIHPLLPYPSAMHLIRAEEKTVPNLWNKFSTIRRWPRYSHIKTLSNLMRWKWLSTEASVFKSNGLESHHLAKEQP